MRWQMPAGCLYARVRGLGVVESADWARCGETRSVVALQDARQRSRISVLRQRAEQAKLIIKVFGSPR